MFDETIDRRVRPLAEAFAASDMLRATITDGDFELELRRSAVPSYAGTVDPAAETAVSVRDYDVVTADLVGIVHLSRPIVAEGTFVESDRELAYVEALGIRNPVRSRGAGRIAIVYIDDGQPVEYGQPLFAIDRG